MNDDIKKVVRIFPTIDAANAAVSLLATGGIETVAASNESENKVPGVPGAAGIRLLVKTGDEARARKILAVALPVAGDAEPGNWESAAEGVLKESRRRAPVIVGLFLMVLFVIPMIIALVIVLGRF